MPDVVNAHIPICYGDGRSIGCQITLGAAFVLESRFTGVKLILANYGDTEMRFAGMCAAASLTASSIVTPTGGAWVPVTVDGALPIVPAGCAARPAIVVTDLLPIESLARTDGGSGYLLYTRASGEPDRETCFNMAGLLSSTAEFNSATPGRPLMYFYCGGDYASGTSQAELHEDGVASSTLPAFVVAGVIFYSEEGCHTLWGVGDSLTMGLQAGAGYSGFGRHAASHLNDRSHRVSYVDAGYPGQTTEQFLARARDLLDAGVPAHFMTIPIDSANDYAATDGSGSRVRQEINVLSFLDTVISRGILPIMATSLPLMQEGVDICGQQRVVGSTKLRAMERRGIPVLDAQAIIAGYVPTPERPAVTPPNFLGEDKSHLSAAGQAAIATGLVEILEQLLPDAVAA